MKLGPRIELKPSIEPWEEEDERIINFRLSDEDFEVLKTLLGKD